MGKRRGLLRAISNLINSNDFDDLELEIREERINHLHDMLTAHFMNLIPLPGVELEPVMEQAAGPVVGGIADHADLGELPVPQPAA